MREFVASVAERGVASTTVHAHARAVRAFLRFAYEENWIEEPVTVRMPRVEQKRMEVLTREEVRRVLRVCGTRDRALVLTLIDSGLRRGEALALDWDDLDLHTGMIHVHRGKGGKARVTYLGAINKKGSAPLGRRPAEQSDLSANALPKDVLLAIVPNSFLGPLPAA